jgi:hypothetical protein
MPQIQNYRFGESVQMPTDRPFHWVVDGRTYLLTHTLGNDGEIRMAVDIDDRSSRRPMQDARRSPHIQHDLDDLDALDPVTGLLRDGHALRVRLQEMRDNRGTGPLVINSGLHLDRIFNPDGTLRNRDAEPRKQRKTRTDPAITETDHQPGQLSQNC